MAEGGEAGFCAAARAHDPSCQYFAEGGEADGDIVPADKLPDNDDGDIVPADKLPSDDGDIVPADKLPDDSDVVPNENLTPEQLQAAMVDKAHPEGIGGFQAPSQQLAGIAESAAQGVAGPLATLAETKILGVPESDIVARQEANPLEHDAAHIAGVLASPLGKAVNVIKGGALLKGAVFNGLVQANDEVSKWMLGQGDPEHPVGAALAHIGAAALFGIGGGALGAAGQKPLSKVASKLDEANLGTKAEYFLYGLASKDPLPAEAMKGLPKAAANAYKAGQKAFLLPPVLGASTQAALGYKEDGVKGALKGAWSGMINGLVADVGGGIVRYVAGPVIVQAMQRGITSGLAGAIDHAVEVAAGSKLVNHAAENLMKGLSLEGQSFFTDVKKRERLDEFIDGGGLHQQLENESRGVGMDAKNYAEGGVVQPKKAAGGLGHNDGFATIYPEQNVIMHAAKGRIAQYLTTLKPQKNTPKLAFDDDPDTTQQKKKYHRALDIANAPLSVLKSVGDGTLDPEHVQHFNAMYPEVNSLIQKSLTEAIVKAQLDGKKPPYKVRQGLSMLLGTPLSSDMTPANVMAAQAVFAKAAPPPPPSQSGSPKKNTSTLTKSDQAFLTRDQARNKREQRA